MNHFSRRLFGIAAVFVFALTVSACGDPEPEQRKAFIEFLQKMVDRQGVHVMNTLPADEKTFGDYTKHYAVIIDFNQHMKAISEKSANKMIQMGLDQTKQRTIEQMVSHRADIVAASQQVGEMRTAIAQELAAAFGRVLAQGGVGLPPTTLMLWRHRLGVAAVLGILDVELDGRALMRALVGSGKKSLR